MPSSFKKLSAITLTLFFSITFLTPLFLNNQIVYGQQNAKPNEGVSNQQQAPQPNQETPQQKAKKEELINKLKETSGLALVPKNLNTLHSQLGITWPDGGNNSNSLIHMYCQTLPIIHEYITAAQKGLIIDDEAKKANAGEFSSGTCNILRKPTSNDQYYANSNEKNADINRNGQIDSELEACLLIRNQKVQECIQCRVNPKDPKGQDCANFEKYPNLSCEQLECTREDEKPTFQGVVDRAPFGTEYFNVNDPNRGLTGPGQAQQNFNPNVEGGPLVGTINTIANFLAIMISTLSLVVFVIGSFMLVIANGDENKINTGKDALKYSLLGILIVLSSYTIVTLVQSLFF